MILAVDIGNSNIVLGGVREKEILFQARIVTDHIKTSDQYCAELKTMLDLFGVSAQEIEGGALWPPSCRRCSIRSAPPSAS